MNSASAERVNLRIQGLLAESSVWNWRLPFQNYSLTSTHGSNDNDRSINILRPSHLPVSA